MSDIAIGRTASAVMTEILDIIRHGEFRPGQQLPAERALAERFGVARNTLRQALRRLENNGVLVRHVGRGTFVREDALRRPSEPFGLSRRMREASPSDLMEVRIMLEPQAAALAAHRANAEDFRRIDGILRNSVSAKGLAEFEHWDAQLHLAIFEATKNAVLIDYCAAINAVRDEPAWYQLKKRMLTPDLRITYDRQHTDLVAALKSRDSEAARALAAAHLTTVRDNLIGAPS